MEKMKQKKLEQNSIQRIVWKDRPKILDDTHPTYDGAHCSKDDHGLDFKVDDEPFPLKPEFLSRNQPKPQTCAVAEVLKNGRNLPENPFRYYSKFNAEVPTYIHT